MKIKTHRNRHGTRPSIRLPDRSLKSIKVWEKDDGLVFWTLRNDGSRSFYYSTDMTRSSIGRMKRMLDNMTVSVDLKYDMIRLTYIPK